MSVNSQIINIINDIEELKEETTNINNTITTISTNIQNFEATKQDTLKVTDTINVYKAKLSFITLSGNDLQTTLGTLGDDIISKNDDIDALQLLTSSHTSEISSNDTDINALQILTTSHTSEINSKQSQITDQTNIECMDIVADNIILRPVDLFGDDIDITKGSISFWPRNPANVVSKYDLRLATNFFKARPSVSVKGR